MEIFSYQDYRHVIRDKIKENKKIRGYQSLLAKSAGCQRSYFSQAMNGQVQLTPEHALGLAQLWGLNGDEAEHFLDLIHWDRAGSRTLQGYYASRVKARQKAREDVVNRLNLKTSSLEADKMVYYSTWLHGAIHILSSIPQFQTAEAMAQRIQIPVASVIKSLDLLVQLGVVERSASGRYTPKTFHIHLPRSSPWTSVHHAQWRQRANFSVMEGDSEAFHFTGVHSMSRQDFQRLKEMLFQFIEASSSLVKDSKEEELYCLALDLFRG